MKLYPHHPLAELFPMIEGDEYASFVADIKANELQRPVLLVKEGRQLLVADGRTRQKACNEAGVQCRYEEWDGKGDLLKKICSLNMRNRTMSKTDRAVTAEAAMTHIDLPPETAANLQSGNRALIERIATLKADIASEMFGVSPRYIHHVRSIRKFAPRTYKALQAREINLSQAISRVEREKREKDATAKAAEAKITKGALKLIHGDAVEEMGRLPGGCATVVFIDPPYNNKWAYDSDPTGDDLNDGEYLDGMQRVITSATRLLAANGSIFVLIDDNYTDHFGLILRRIGGLHRRNTIVWWETFGVHQTGNFSRCARFLHYYTIGKKGFIWHPVPVESARQRLGDSRANQDGKCPDNVWQIPRVNGNDSERVPFEDMPPQVPVELPRRAILAASEPGDLVVDCFNGNGTTGLAAILAGRKYIGIDRSAKYLEQSERWIKSQIASRKEGDNA
jgi:DNA modification methylase